MRSRVGALVLVALAVGLTTGPALAQAGGLSLDATTAQAEPGGEVAVTFEAANQGDTASAAIVNITDRPDWSLANRTDDGGLWRESGKWLFQTIDAGGTTAPTLVLSVPESVSGDYTVSAMITNGETTDRATATIKVSSGTGGPGGLLSGSGLSGFQMLGIALAAFGSLMLLSLRLR